MGVGFYFAFRIFMVLLSVRILGTEPQTGTALNLALNISSSLVDWLLLSRTIL